MNPKMQKKCQTLLLLTQWPLIGLCNLHWPFSIFFKSLMSKKATGIKKSQFLTVWPPEKKTNEILHFSSLWWHSFQPSRQNWGCTKIFISLYYTYTQLGWLLSSVKKGKPQIIINTLEIFPCTSFGFSMNILTII